ncbi:hypothetical protein VPH35_009487 [Triticum aestivum]
MGQQCAVGKRLEGMSRTMIKIRRQCAISNRLEGMSRTMIMIRRQCAISKPLEDTSRTMIMIRMQCAISKRLEGTNRTMNKIRGDRVTMATKGSRIIELNVATGRQIFRRNRVILILQSSSADHGAGRMARTAAGVFRRKKFRTAGIFSTESSLVYTFVLLQLSLTISRGSRLVCSFLLLRPSRMHLLSARKSTGNLDLCRRSRRGTIGPKTTACL